MDLTIIIPTKDRNEIFAETLRSAVEAVRDIDAEIVVVNDSAVSRPVIPESHCPVRLIDNPKKGVASARNAGASIANAPLILFLDDDILIHSRSIHRVLAFHNTMKGACLNVNWEYPPDLRAELTTHSYGRFVLASGLVTFKGWYGDNSWRDETLFVSKSVASFHLSISKDDFVNAGGYNEGFPHAGFEDYEFPLRLKQAGISFYIDSSVTVFHNERDRSTMAAWLNNWQRRSETRKVAVELGRTELTLRYPLFKKWMFAVTDYFENPIVILIRKLSPLRWTDFLGFRLIGLLQANRIYRGYTSVRGQ